MFSSPEDESESMIYSPLKYNQSNTSSYHRNKRDVLPIYQEQEQQVQLQPQLRVRHITDTQEDYVGEELMSDKDYDETL